MDKTAIYQHSWEYAAQNGEQDAHRASRAANEACAQAIDKAVRDNNYDTFRYNLDAAAKTVIGQFGLDRVNFVLVGCIQQSFNDARYSQTNRDWAGRFDIPDDRHGGFHCDTHPHVLDGFADEARTAHFHAMAQEVGRYENSKHIAAKNRLTSYDAEQGVFVSKVPFGRLWERHHEIMERMETRRASAIERLAAAKRDVKPPAPKGAGKKKDLAVE